MFILSNRSKRNRLGIDSRLIEVSDLAIQITKIDFGIPTFAGLRSAEQQNQLYMMGKSKADGYKKISNHQRGRAIDFYAYVDGQGSWKHLHLSMIACAFLQAGSQLGYSLEWGGNFRSFLDMPHIQLKD